MPLESVYSDDTGTLIVNINMCLLEPLYAHHHPETNRAILHDFGREHWSTQMMIDYRILTESMYNNRIFSFPRVWRFTMDWNEEAVFFAIQEAYKNMMYVAYLAPEEDIRCSMEPEEWQDLWFGPWRPELEAADEFIEAIEQWRTGTDEEFPRRRYHRYLRNRAFGLAGPSDFPYVDDWSAPFWKYYEKTQRKIIQGRYMTLEDLYAHRKVIIGEERELDAQSTDERIPWDTPADFQWDEDCYGPHRVRPDSQEDDTQGRNQPSQVQVLDAAFLAKFEADIIREMGPDSSDNNDKAKHVNARGSLTDLSLPLRPKSQPGSSLKRRQDSSDDNDRTKIANAKDASTNPSLPLRTKSQPGRSLKRKQEETLEQEQQEAGIVTKWMKDLTLDEIEEEPRSKKRRMQS